MGGLLGGGGDVVKPPPVPKTPPLPTVDEDKVGTQARKDRPRGFRETFLTGALVPSKDELKKKKLGGDR